MRGVWIVGKMSLLENSRKQVFHVLCLLVLTVIASSTLLSIFTEGVKLKMLKDLCMSVILFGGAVLAIALGSSGIPNDVDARTIHPLLARPLTRSQYVVGKFLGTLLTVAAGVAAMSLVFGTLIYSFQRSIDPFLITAMGFALLEVGVIAAVATAISAVATPAVTAVLTFLIYICGAVKIGYFGAMIEKSGGGMTGAVSKLVYHLVPNLECFNLRAALVHQDAVPVTYLVQVAVYGVCYTAFALMLGCLCFGRKEV